MIVRRANPVAGVDLSLLGSCAQRVAQGESVEGSRVWLAVEAGRACGYVLTAPLPGLPALHEIEFFVAPSCRRKGTGSLLWREAKTDLANDPGVRRVSAALEKRDGALARFLTAHGFFPEHVEWEMRRETLDDLDDPAWPGGYEPATFSRPEAIDHFIALYDASFSPQRWYQPYSRGEVAGSLDSSSGLLFAVTAGQPVGVAWMRLEGELGVIEPIGVMPAHQGKGVGRALLAEALSRMRNRGARGARLGVWKDNKPAIALYRQMGFRHRGSRTYLAYEFDDPAAGRRLR